ncbi:purine-cytosine permease FCY21 [Parathielavia hyrcaniae]|uniref:Purine-cytosine permease FCY21 n=1 Tax=Parathielavia hyrcaniae TaxID=113614 RepID=A0AAN6QEJ0_9PEZI|nr:purine-cytosine permease FCY21 [Parathielavia hyrcaniae]
MGAVKTEADVESPSSTNTLDTPAPGEVISGIAVGDIDGRETLWARLESSVGRYGVEQRGNERVLEDDKEDTSAYKLGAVVKDRDKPLSMCSSLVTPFTMGAIAVPVLGLGFVDSALIIVLVSFVGALPVALFCCFGAKFGLRQMVLSRLFFGHYMSKLLAVIQIIVCIIWTSINAVVGAQLFHAVNPSVPGWAAILLTILLSFFLGLFGYKVIHAYERWAWLPCMTVLLITMGVFASSGRFNSLLPLSTEPAEVSSVLSYSSGIWSYMAGWASFAADYSVYQPSSGSLAPVFLWSFAGLFIPTLLGAAVTTATIHEKDYLAAYSDAGIGGLLAAVLRPVLGRFGDFCIVVLALSMVANTCATLYSVSFSLQALGRATQRIPRFLWTVVAVGVCVAIAVPAYDSFATWLSNIVLVLGYFTPLYVGVMLPEHFVFRRSFSVYQAENFDKPEALPPGYVASLAFGIGVVGVALGMAQTWYTGPISRLCGDGGDVGFLLGLGFPLVSYLILRPLETRSFGR